MPTEAINKISVLVVDDHPTIRTGIRAILERVPDFCVVGEAGNGDEAQKLIAELHPKILLQTS